MRIWHEPQDLTSTHIIRTNLGKEMTRPSMVERTATVRIHP